MFGKKAMIAASAVSNVDFVASIVPPAGKSFNYNPTIKLDSDGSVYHLGSTDETDAQIDAQLIKFNSDATVEYKKAYAMGSSTTTTQVPVGISLGGTDLKISMLASTYDPSVVTIDSTGAASAPRAVITNLGNAGGTVTTNHVGGYFWVAGEYRFSSTKPRVGIIAKVDSSNNSLVSTIHSGTGSGTKGASVVRGLYPDGSGNLYGIYYDDYTDFNYVVFKMPETGGSSTWAHAYSLGSYEVETRSATNAAGNTAIVYTNTTTNICKIELRNSSGVLSWCRQHSVGTIQQILSVYIDDANNIYYTYGRSSISNFLVKINSSGSFVYARSFSGTYNESFYVNGDPSTSAVVVGSKFYVVKADGDNFFTGTYQGLTTSSTSLTVSSSTTSAISTSFSFPSLSGSQSTPSVFTKTANPTIGISVL
jgi:hypothetical protein